MAPFSHQDEAWQALDQATNIHLRKTAFMVDFSNVGNV
jgi:hypothetical protein